MARLQVAGRLRQVPEVVDFERAATFTKPEKRGRERRRLNIMERAPSGLRRGNSCRSGRLRWRLQFRFFDDVELENFRPTARGLYNARLGKRRVKPLCSSDSRLRPVSVRVFRLPFDKRRFALRPAIL